MKPTKLGALALTAALALGAYSAKAGIVLTTSYYSKLNVSLTITTNCVNVWNGNVEKFTTKTVKIGNKELLTLFAHWASTTWPAGAQLVVGWDWDSDVLVVDKTGTNVLYDTIGDYNGAYTHFFYLHPFADIGAGTGNRVNADPGSETVSSLNGASFELYDDYYLPYTELEGYGGSRQSFKQTWDVHDNPLKWSDTESATFPNQGDEYWFDSSSNTTISGSISASGHGIGYNYLGWAD